MGCLCGCGGDNLHCLRPNRPPSPNTFYENFWAPEFAYMLKTRLELAAMNLEPSKRIWWRETFGGYAPDREPLESETWAYKIDDLGTVLRTSPLPVENEAYGSRVGDEERFQRSSRRQRSASPLNTNARSPDEAANTPLRRFTHGRVHASKSGLLDDNGERPTKNFLDHWFNATSSGHSSAQTPTPPLSARPLKSPTHYVPDEFPPLNLSDFFQRCPTRARNEPRMGEENELLHQKGRRKIETTRLRLNRGLGIDADRGNGMAGENLSSTSKVRSVSGAGEAASKTPANDWSHVHASRKSPFRAPAVRPRVKSPKSPTHYIPDRLPPLEIPDFSKKRPVRHKIKITTVEEDEQLRQSGLRKVEATRLRLLHRFYGKPLERSENSSTESPRSTSQGGHDHAGELLSNAQIKDKKPTSPKHVQNLQLPVRKVDANDAQTNRLCGKPLDRYKVSSAESPLSTSQGGNVAKVPSNTQIKEKDTITEENVQLLESERRELKPTDCEMHHQHRDMSVVTDKNFSTKIQPPTSQSDYTEDIPSKIQKQPSTTEESQQSRPSLYLKIEAMKLRRSCREGSAIYRFGDQSDYTEKIQSNVQKQSSTAEEPQQSKHLYLKIEAMKLRRNCRQGTAIYRFGDASAENSSSTSGLDQFAGMSSKTLPKFLV